MGIAHWDIPIPEFCWTKVKFCKGASPCALFQIDFLLNIKDVFMVISALLTLAPIFKFSLQ